MPEAAWQNNEGLGSSQAASLYLHQLQTLLNFRMAMPGDARDNFLRDPQAAALQGCAVVFFAATEQRVAFHVFPKWRG